MGETGRVTDPIGKLIEGKQVDVIYSCGPMAMLRAISELTAGTDVVHQCAVEEAMACGIGICMTCVLPVMDESGKVAMLRSCIDGPVMDGSQVQWQMVGQVPEALA
jgi:dihydroorotate dehydrogenase electron transfer subunit